MRGPSLRRPTVVVVTPGGLVLSPWTPGPAAATGRSVALASLGDGTHRTLLVGGDAEVRARVVVRALGGSRTFQARRAEARTVAATNVRGLDG